MRTLVFGRIHRCARRRALPQRVPQATLAGRADNGAAIYVIPGRETPTMRRSIPEYVDPNAYVPWPHGADLPPVPHRRQRTSPRVRALILVLVGAVIAFLALGAVAAFADDPEPLPPPPGTEAPATPRPLQTPPPAPEPDDVLAGDIVWTRTR